jgi:hypothetical protein
MSQAQEHLSGMKRSSLANERPHLDKTEDSTSPISNQPGFSTSSIVLAPKSDSEAAEILPGISFDRKHRPLATCYLEKPSTLNHHDPVQKTGVKVDLC